MCVCVCVCVCTQNKATHITVQCKSCKGILEVPCKPGMGGANVPSYCNLQPRNMAGQDKCAPQPYVVRAPHSPHAHTLCIDTQTSPEHYASGTLSALCNVPMLACVCVCHVCVTCV